MVTSTRPGARVLSEILVMTEDVLQSKSTSASRQAAISHLRRIFDANGAVFVAPERPIPLRPADAEVAGQVSELPSLYGHYLHEDPGLPLLQRARRELRPRVLTSDVFFRGNCLLRTRYYREVMQPLGMHHALAMLLATEHRSQGVVVLYRGKRQAPFASREVAAAMASLPVLSAALGNIARIGQSGDEHPYQSIAVLDERLRVLYRDVSGPAFLTSWLIESWHEHETLRSFAQHCRALLAGDAEVSDRVLSIPAQGSGTQRIGVEVRRIARENNARLVLLLRADDPMQGNIGDLASLSPREFEVARLIAEGASQAQVAARLELSVHTVAHHLASVYQKTRVTHRAALAARLAPSASRSVAVPGLTTRERQILAQLLEGSSNKSIAAQFGLSLPTVSNHLQKIYRKAQVHDRVALIRKLRS